MSKGGEVDPPTRLRLETEFVYLAVVLDAHSRRVIGWSLDRTIDVGLPLAALRMALDQRSPAAGLVHHSDRGSVYASKDYTDLLKEHGAVISMSRRGKLDLPDRVGSAPPHVDEIFVATPVSRLRVSFRIPYSPPC
jgi:transposase InsO family protein